MVLDFCQMVKERLRQPDAQENGWLLDGYPRSYSQAMALETLEIRPDTFILLDVSVQLHSSFRLYVAINLTSSTN
jgi:adenylate kinase family enzyme